MARLTFPQMTYHLLCNWMSLSSFWEPQMIYGSFNRRRGGLKMNIDKVRLSKQYWNFRCKINSRAIWIRSVRILNLAETFTSLKVSLAGKCIGWSSDGPRKFPRREPRQRNVLPRQRHDVIRSVADVDGHDVVGPVVGNLDLSFGIRRECKAFMLFNFFVALAWH